MTTEEIRKRYPYLYETHLHTCQGSACGRKTGAEMAQACRDAGYTGIFVTDHNWGGNTAVDRSLPWEEWVERFSAGFRDAKERGDAIGLDVFYGWEAGFDGTEFLIYGISPEEMKKLPRLRSAGVEEQYELVKAAGGMVIHAHPFRETDYIPEIRLMPACVDGVEGMNATHTSPLSGMHKNGEEYDRKARSYAAQYGFPITAGSDVHDTVIFGGGVAFTRKLTDARDYVRAVLGGEDYAVTDGVHWFSRSGEALD